MSHGHLAVIGGYLRQHWRRVGLLGLGVAAGIMILIQLLFPWNNLPLYQTVDGVDVSGWNRDDAITYLDDKYDRMPVNVYFGKSPKVYREPLTGDIGLSVRSQPQVDSAMYQWWLRLIPTSLWWAHSVTDPKPPVYDRNDETLKRYIAKELGESCDIKPVNATLGYKDKKLDVTPAIDGGTCKLEDVEKVLAGVTPTLGSHDVRIAMTERPAVVRDEQAQKLAARLTEQTKDGVTVKAGDQTVTIPQQEILSWLDFVAPDSGIAASVNADRSKDFFAKQLLPKVAIAPGTSRVTTLDFTEIARADGPSGRTLDTEQTIALLNAWLKDSSKQPVAATKVVPPTVNYTRTYTPTDTGMSALISQYAQSHPGTFGVSFAELDGKKRHAGYEETKMFRTASTYKLFVAYGALKRVESGAWRWTDQIHGGRSLTKCLDDMIVKSDNPCGETMLSKIGYKTLTNELKAIGLARSSFLGKVPETTAGDLTTFVGALQSGQLLSPSSTSTLLSAMKRNIYRQGIPAGANGQTANKVGFLEGYLHDAAIVYSPSGTYVLSIMTEGSNWGAIADLTRQIEKLRTQG